MKTTKIMQHLIGKTYKDIVDHLRTEEDWGDCCGWSECSIEDSLVNLEDKESAVLIDVVEIDYSDEYSNTSKRTVINTSERTVINFIFDLGDKHGLILGYELKAGSGSGWSYGAYVTLYYDESEVASAIW